MTHGREPYRQLPGRRRGILRGASMWMAGDHLLFVKSYRVSEEYKRFQFRDVQAIVVARCPRFHISTRSLFIAFLWVWAYGVGSQLLPKWYSGALWAIAAALVCAWFYISFAQSCRCRILTAVSSDELPSVYRTWTARRFLADVEPRISEVQGRLVGNWFEALDALPVPGGTATEPAADRPTARGRTFWSASFVALLFVKSVSTLVTLHSPVTLVVWLGGSLVIAQMIGMIGIFVQRHQGVLRPGMQWLAIATVVKIGLSYYVAIGLVSAAAATNPAMERSLSFAISHYPVLRVIDACVELVLGLAGAALLLVSEHSE